MNNLTRKQVLGFVAIWQVLAVFIGLLIEIVNIIHPQGDKGGGFVTGYLLTIALIPMLALLIVFVQWIIYKLNLDG